MMSPSYLKTNLKRRILNDKASCCKTFASTQVDNIDLSFVKHTILPPKIKTEVQNWKEYCICVMLMTNITK